jgi:hypothetical protein
MELNLARKKRQRCYGTMVHFVDTAVAGGTIRARGGGHGAADEPDVNINSKSINSRMPLSYGTEKGHEAMVKLLLGQPGVNPDSKDDYDRTPLSWAAEKGYDCTSNRRFTGPGHAVQPKMHLLEVPSTHSVTRRRSSTRVSGRHFLSC